MALLLRRVSVSRFVPDVPDSPGMTTSFLTAQQDKIDWGQVNASDHDALSLAALRGNLYWWWSGLKSFREPYYFGTGPFASRSERMPLRVKVHRKDFERLDEVSQHDFQLLNGFDEKHDK